MVVAGAAELSAGAALESAGAAAESAGASAGAIEESAELSAAGVSVVVVVWPQAATPKARTAAAAAATPIWIFVIGYYPSSQRQGLPPTREANACQGLTEMASVGPGQVYAYLHSAESRHQASAAAASASSSCAKLGCITLGTEPRPISTET